jgi:EAL domain-containing protein (putative c-di-GMP-specific phosphodiesterase class I)
MAVERNLILVAESRHMDAGDFERVARLPVRQDQARPLLREQGRSDHHAAAIVRAVLSLGKNQQVPVLAEGVETQAHLDFLRDEKCDEVQGFLMGYPVPHERIEALVTIGAVDAASKVDLKKADLKKAG